jgi:hypothetical protein
MGPQSAKPVGQAFIGTCKIALLSPRIGDKTKDERNVFEGGPYANRIFVTKQKSYWRTQPP